MNTNLHEWNGANSEYAALGLGPLVVEVIAL